jgi:hypothetical protein
MANEIIDTSVKKLISKIQGPKCTTQAHAIVRLYTATPQQKWLYSGLEGILCLVHDRENNSQFLRIFETENLELAFECELYYNFHKYYKQSTRRFYYFEIYDSFVGFSFSTEKEAEEVFTKV